MCVCCGVGQDCTTKLLATEHRSYVPRKRRTGRQGKAYQRIRSTVQVSVCATIFLGFQIVYNIFSLLRDLASILDTLSTCTRVSLQEHLFTEGRYRIRTKLFHLWCVLQSKYAILVSITSQKTMLRQQVWRMPAKNSK